MMQMRRILLVVGIVVAVIVIALIAIVSLVDVNKYRPRIQAELQAKLGRPVTLGEMHLRLLPFSVRVDGASIGESPEFHSSQPFAQASEVYVSVGLFSLIGGNPQVKAIELTQPHIEIIRNVQGVWNFSSIGTNEPKPAGQTPSPAPSNAATSSPGGGLSLDKLTITDGQVAYTDEQQHQPRTVYDHIDAKLTDFAPGNPFHVDLSVHLPGQGKQTMSLNAKVGPLAGGPPSEIPIHGTFNFDEVTLSGITKFASGAVPLNTDSTITGKGSIKTTAETAALKGDLKLENTTIKGVKIGYPIEAQYDVTDNRKTDLLTIQSADVNLGSTPISVSGTVDSGKKPADLNIQLKAKNASITELAKLAGALGIALNPQYQMKGMLTADINAKGPSSDPRLSGSIQGRQLEASGGEIKQPVSVPEIDVTLSPTNIVSNPFVAQSGNTKLNIAFSLAQYTSSNPTVDASINTNGADVADLLDMAKAYGVQAAQGGIASGKLTLNVHAAGPIKDTTKMIYSGSGSVSGVTLKTADLAKPLTINSANLQFVQNGASINNLSVALGSSNVQGNLSAKNFSAPEIQFSLSSTNINLDELQQITATQKPAAGPPPQQQQAAARPAAAKTLPPANEPSLLSKVIGGGTIEAAKISVQQFVLTNVKSTARIDHGVITLSPLTASIFGGSEAGAIILDTRPRTSTCSIKTKFSGVDTNQLLSAVSSVKNRIYGSLNADANLGFTLASGSDLARTLNGTLNFDVANGKIQGVNLLKELSAVGKFLGSSPAQGNGPQTAIKKLSGTLNIQNGVANTNDLIAALNEGSLSGKGSINLINEGLNMHATAVLSSGTSQQVGGSKVGGFLNTALANNNGELVIPVIITGTLEHPAFAPDTQAIAEMKLKHLLPTSGAPGKLGSGILGGILGGQQSGNKNQQNNTQGIVNGILGQFGKKKK
jgi:uncharacterized protein involved in outer membrane biogenesis